jgi:hypothetical protein
MNVQIGICAECKRKLLVFMGRCHECRRALAHKSLESKPANGFAGQSGPNIERFENCVLEIDRRLGRIFVHLPTGKTKVKVSRIPLGRLTLELIDVIVTSDSEAAKCHPSGPPLGQHRK